MTNLNSEDVFFYFIWIILATIIVIFIYSMYRFMEHGDYMEKYVGREFIFKKDTVRVLEYDIDRQRFILSKHGIINEDIIYKLREVTYE